MTALRAFDAAARYLHFAKAAKELAVTPGAISRQIQSLEEDLQVKLFQRNNNSVALTAIGKIYATEVAIALDRLNTATYNIRTHHQTKPLSICTYPTFAMRWLIPKWRKFHDLHPNIDLQLTTSTKNVDTIRDGFDAVIRFGDGLVPGHTAIRLASVKLFPVCSPAVSKTIKTPDDLRQHILIHSVTRPDDWFNWLRSADASSEIDSKSGLKFESLGLAYQAAIEGAGVAIAMDCLVLDDLALKRLVRPFDVPSKEEGAFYLLHANEATTDPRLKALCTFLEQEATAVTAVL